MNSKIRTFLEELLEDAGQNDMSAEVKEVMLEDLNGRLEKRVMLVLIEALDAEAMIEFKEKFGGGQNLEEVEGFFRDKVENFEEVVKGAMESFRELYLGREA